MATIDEKVVQLDLDDSQFNKASDRTIKKLDELKNALKFDGAVGSFKEIDKAAKDVELSPLEKGVQQVSLQFNALYAIADTTFRRIINGAVDSGERMLKSLTVDNITAGWSKYEEKTASVQTIMAATSKQFSDTGVQMEYVEKQLEKLNWFTDETSYSFLDMVNNIGKFTSNNIALDTSVTAMQGIANWAAISGANVGEAGRAMYNLSQALATGAVKLIDWKSIENANMATAEFKQTAIETAVEIGTLTKIGDGLYQTMQGNEVSVSNFNDALSDAWFTSDVLMSSLDRYGAFTDKLYEMTEATGATATEVLGFIDDYNDGTIDMEAAMSVTGLSAEKLTEWLDILGSEEYELGRRALKAGQESKTFSDALNAVKDAVSSGWMTSFELIFGNYEEAKELWSEVAEGLYEAFVESGNARNELLKGWKEVGGRDTLIDALRTGIENLYQPIQIVSDAFRKIFPEMTVERLVQLTDAFATFVGQLRLSESAAENIGNIFTGLFSILKTIGSVVGAVVAGLDPLLNVFNRLAGMVLKILGDLGLISNTELGGIFDRETLVSIYNTVYKISSILAYIIELVALLTASGIGKVSGFITKIVESLKNGEGVIGSFRASFSEFLNAAQNGLSSLFSGRGIDLGGGFSGVSKILDVIGNSILSSSSTIAKGCGLVIKVVSNLFNWLEEVFSSVTIVDLENMAILAVLIKLALSINDIANYLSEAAEGLGNVFDSLAAKIGGKGAVLAEIAEDTKYLQMALMIGVLASSLAKLSEIPVDKLGTAVVAMSAVIGVIALLTEYLKKVSTTLSDDAMKNFIVLSKSVIQFSIAIGILSASVYLLGQMDFETIAKGLLALVGSLASVFAFSYGMKELGTTGKDIQKASTGIVNMAVGLSAMAVPIFLLGSMDLHTLGQGLLSVVGILTIFGTAAALLSNIKTGSVGILAISIAGMAVALTALTVPIFMLGSMDLATLGQGVISVIGLLSMFGVAATLLEKLNVTGLLSAAGSMIAIAIAMTALSIPIFMLGSMDLETLVKGFASIVVMIGVLVGELTLLAKISGAGGAGTMALIAADLTILAVAMNLFAASMITLNSVEPSSFAMGLGLVLTTLLGFSVAAVICQSAAVGVLALSASFIAIAGAVAIVIGSITDLINSVTRLVEAIAKISDIVMAFTLLSVTLGDEFPNAVEAGMDAVHIILERLLDSIIALSPKLGQAAMALVGAFVNAILQSVPTAIQAVGLFALGILEVLANLGGPIIDALTRTVKGLTEGLPKLMKSIGEFIEELFAGIGVLVYHAIVGVIRAALEAIGLGWLLADEVSTSGAEMTMNDTADAMTKGSEAIVQAANDAGVAVGEAYLDGQDEALDRHSPPGEVLDTTADIGEAWGMGIEDILPIFTSTGYLSGDSYMQGLASGLTDGALDVNNLLSGLLGYGQFEQPSSRDRDGGITHVTSSDSPRAEAKRLREKTDEEEGYDAGDDWMDGFGDGLLGNTGGYGSATESANRIRDIYEDALDDIDRRADASALEYERWVTFNQSADQVSKDAKELEQANDQYQFQLERMDQAEKYWKDAIKEYGEDSLEVAEAHTAYVEAQIETEQMRRELVDLMDGTAQQLEDLESREKTAELEYGYWESMNQNASDMEKVARQIQYQNDQIISQAQRLDYARKLWIKAQKDYGQDSREATEAYHEYMTQMTKLQDLQNEMGELQEEFNDIQEESITHREELEKRADLMDTNRELQYKIWGLQNSDASDMENRAAELKYLAGELESANLRLTFASDDYHKAVEEYGAGSLEALEAHNNYLVALSDQMQVQDEITQAQKEQAEDMQVAWQAAGKWVAQNMASLQELGFSAEEITRAGLSNFGVPKPEEVQEATAEAQTENQETAAAAAEQINQTYTSVVRQGIEATKPLFTQAGAEYITNLTQSMISEESLVLMTDTIWEFVEYAHEYALSDEVIDQWVDMGEQFMEGWIKGVENLRWKFLNTIISIIETALEMARAAAGIESPSKETTWMGQMLDMGLIKGVEDYGPAVVKTFSDLMDDTIDAVRTSNTLEFAGSLIAGGIASGMDNMSYKVTHASAALVQQMEEAFNSQLTGNQTFWDKMLEDYGLDREDFSYEVVLSLNTDKAYEDMTDFEKAIVRDMGMASALYDSYMPGGGRYVTNDFNEWYAKQSESSYWMKQNHLKDLDALEAAIERAGDEATRKNAQEAYDRAYNEWRAAYDSERSSFEEERGAAGEAWSDAYSTVVRGIEAMKEASKEGTSIEDARYSYVQNIYSQKPLSTLDVYRNTNNLLSSIS